MSSNKINQIRGIHSELNNIIEVLFGVNENNVTDYYLTQIQQCSAKLKEVTGDDPSISINEGYCYFAGESKYCDKNYLLILAKNLKSWIENRHNITSDKSELVGILGRVIEDRTLQKRCFDLLSNSNIENDSVVREANLVLVESIKKRLNVKREDEIDWKDVSKEIKIYEDQKENESFFDLVKSFRNLFAKKTRHELIDNLPQEEAIKLLAFIDLMIGIINNSKS